MVTTDNTKPHRAIREESDIDLPRGGGIPLQRKDYFSLETQQFMLVDGSAYAEYLSTGVYRLPAEVMERCGVTAPLLSIWLRSVTGKSET